LRRDVTIGTAAVLTIAAVVGLATQSRRTPGENSREPKAGVTSRPLPKVPAEIKRICSDPESLIKRFLLVDKEKDVAAPNSCFEDGDKVDHQKDKNAKAVRDRAKKLHFVIATLPDPVHSHLSLLFDRKVEAIQQAALDADFDYDSSWLPWDTSERSFTLLSDQDTSDDRTDDREDQPGIILFRKRSNRTKGEVRDSEQSELILEGGQFAGEGLVVFVVGEEATRGIHRRQFQNATAWIKALNPNINGTSIVALGPNLYSQSVAILGPSFSGSLPSLAQLLSDKDVWGFLNYPTQPLDKDDLRELRIYSGSVSGKQSVEAFGDLTKSDPKLANWRIHFHSFVENDDAILHEYCQYLRNSGLETVPTESEETAKTSHIALVSEDETAYGIGGLAQPPTLSAKTTEATDSETQPAKSAPASAEGQNNPEEEPCPGAVRIFYPRDISALRNAYQARSLFSTSSQSSPENPKRELPTDLADAARETHDTIRAYAENQLALAQEAQLFGIISVLRDHHSEILIIRSTNALDQIFLIRFFRRYYPQGRIALRGADTLFLREHGTGGITGVTALSSYPLIPWDWRDWPSPWDREQWSEDWKKANPNPTGGMPKFNPTHRIFGEETVEGTYIATRFLLQETFQVKNYPDPLNGDPFPVCSSEDPQWCFLPPNLSARFDVPDYKAPFWVVSSKTAQTCARDPVGTECWPYLRPAIWISVLGRDNFYPLLASVSDPASHVCKSKPDSPDDPLNDPRFSMPVGMKLLLCGLLIFALIHTYWCGTASFTAKPAFRAHFAVVDEWFRNRASTNSWQHPALITIASVLIAWATVLSAWACGAFGAAAFPPRRTLYLWSFLIAGITIAFFSIWFNHRAAERLQRSIKPVDNNDEKPEPRPSLKFSLWFWGGLVALFFSVPLTLEGSLSFQNQMPNHWRSMDLASGVSPLLPFLILLAGLYLWFWYSLHGLALFGRDRPRLPKRQSLLLVQDGVDLPLLRMFDRKDNRDTEAAALPLNTDTALHAAVLFVVFAVVAYVATGAMHWEQIKENRKEIAYFIGCDLCASLVLQRIVTILFRKRAAREAQREAANNDPQLRLRKPIHARPLLLISLFAAIIGVVACAVFAPPLRSLGSYRYAIVYCVLLDLCASWLLAEAWQFLEVWRNLKRLLTFLDRLPLRRTMRALQGFSWGNVWKMSGNVLDIRYKVLSRQIESINHLDASLAALCESANTTGLPESWVGMDAVHDEIGSFRHRMREFAIVYAAGYKNNDFADFNTLEKVQQQTAEVTGELITTILLPYWQQETESLIHVDAEHPTELSSAQKEMADVPNHIRSAEELVCITYMGFVQNVLGRLRTMALSIMWLFVAIMLSVISYPFDPRPGLNQALTFVFLVVAVIMFWVYAAMHRDSTLSRVTNTTPGELGMDFWLRILGFGAGPFLTLIAYLFPGLTDFLFSWLQPGMSAMK